MKIDFYELVELLTPTFLRRSRLLSMLRVMVANPLQRLFVRFHLWRNKSRYEASVSPQVISLIHAIERTFDCVAEITELDGKPYDFLVSIDRSADLNAIREFIDRHKLAGKSYVFRLGDAAFSVTWLNHVDEHLVEEYSAEWIDHDDVNGIECHLRCFWNNLAWVPFPDVSRAWAVEVMADKEVTSTIVFTMLLDVTENGYTTRVTESITLAEGDKWMMRNTAPFDFLATVKIVSISATPAADSQHFYDVKY